MVHNNVYSPPMKYIRKGEVIISTFFTCPQDVWDVSQCRNYSKECKIKLMDITVGEPSKNDLVNACSATCALPGYVYYQGTTSIDW